MGESEWDAVNTNKLCCLKKIGDLFLHCKVELSFGKLANKHNNHMNKFVYNSEPLITTVI